MKTARRVAAALTAALAISASADPGAPGAGTEPGRGTEALDWSPAERVELRLARSRALAGAHIEVRDADPPVLHGSVRSEAQAERALRVARRAPGADGVRSELRIDPGLPAPSARTDAELARDVAARLSRADALGGRAAESWMFGWRVEAPGWAVEVDADDGDVTLSGSVPLQQRVLEALRAARAVPGVRSVRTDLRVELDPPVEERHFP